MTAAESQLNAPSALPAVGWVRAVAAGPFRFVHASVTAALDHGTAAVPLAPITATLRAMFGTSTEIPGLAPDLVVRTSGPDGTRPAHSRRPRPVRPEPLGAA